MAGYIMESSLTTKSSPREEKWEQILQAPELLLSRKAFKPKIRKGFPSSLRARFWIKISGVEKIKENHPPEFYEQLLTLSYDSPMLYDISKDINRIFSGHPLFKRGSLGQVLLSNVLTAYNYFDSELGYCQGIGNIAALFLMHMSEEYAFWLLGTLLNKYQIRDLFVPGTPGIYRTMYKINRLFKVFMPDLWTHLQSINVFPTLYAPAWVIPLYINVLNEECYLRFMDILLYEGRKIIYKVFLAIFKCKKSKLLTICDDEIYDYIKTLPLKMNAEKLISKAMSFPINKKLLLSFNHSYENSPDPEFIHW